MEDVGRYRVTRRIAQGGMAEVFEGVALGPEGFQRRVAIKRMRAENAADVSFKRMFLDEAHIASQLHHASIVAVLDFGVADGYPFQVLEFVDGLDGNRLMASGEEFGAPLPLTLALAICTDIAHALEHAHGAEGPDGRSLGIVHRDVSPGNILVSWSGDVKLSDFGIAFARGRLETTSAGLTKGTLLYMAPEQILRGEIDGRTDVFALGCVLHALVTGKSPLAVENAMADLIAGKPLPVSRDLPDDIFDVIVRATRLAKADRFASAGAMADALGKALARRIDTDARTMMREWLGRLRPPPPPQPGTAGRFDGLLVFAGLRKSLPPSLPPTAPPSPPPPLPDEGSGERPAPERRWALATAVVGIAAVAAAAAVVTVWATAAGKSAAAADAAPVAVRADAAAALVEVPPPDAAIAPVVAVVDAGAPVVVVERPHPRPPVDREPRPPVDRDPRPRPIVGDERPAGNGVLVIGGDGALRAEILVDGASRGFAPRILLLPIGEHEVVLVRGDGTRVRRNVQLQATHTPSAPLRWVVP